jgi:Fic family protein
MRIPEKPPDVDKLLELLKKADPELILKSFSFISLLDSKKKYSHWDKIKYLPIPKLYQDHKFDHKTWWSVLKLARRNRYNILPISGLDNIPFKYIIIDDFQKTLHFLDQYASGNISLEKPILNKQMKDTYLIRSLIEEAITSSQLEGATTTRDVAKKMIRDGRSPRDKSERMILNNYNAIQFIRTVAENELTPELIKEIHKVIADKTLDHTEKTGIFRDEDDDIYIMTDNTHIVFTPPDHKEISQRIQELCNFANRDDYTDFFIHPVIKAIFIHFYFAYIHPFIDGNGRTARALFYWYMIKKGYWLIEFISISRILKQAPAKYGRSFLYTETDENDVTYFIDYQLNVIERAIQDLNEYIKKKSLEIQDTETLLANTSLAHTLNLRQLFLLKHALRFPGNIYNIRWYMNTHNIAYETARKDLFELSDTYHLLIKVKEKKSFLFISPSDLKQRIQQ